MPDWQPEWSDVAFDHRAAAEAMEECHRAARRLDAIAERRSTLTTTTAEQWRGRFREDFDRGFSLQQRWLADLADRLRRQAAAIADAANSAGRLQAEREADRTRWREEDRRERQEATPPQ